jgi:hypothetical protein
MLDATPTAGDITALVESAILAPSVLNTQPWLFRSRAGVIDLYADPRRGLPVTDPQGRARAVSCGAALLNLRLAVFASGRIPVLRLLPDPSDPDHLAEVRIGGRHVATPVEQRLHSAIPLRRTNRLPFSSDGLEREVVPALVEAAAIEGGILHVLARSEVPDIIRSVRAADRALRRDQAARREILGWIRRNPSARDGISQLALGPAPRDPSAMVRDFAMATPIEGRGSADFETSPTLAVLYTRGDSPAEWVVAGQALQRVLLTATTHDVSSSLLTQPLEMPGLRGLLRVPTVGPVVPQALLRLGYGGTVPPTPRRPLAEVFDIE